MFRDCILSSVPQLMVHAVEKPIINISIYREDTMNTFREVPGHLHTSIDQVLEDHQITEDTLVTSEQRDAVDRAVDQLVKEIMMYGHLEAEMLARGADDFYQEVGSESKGYIDEDLNRAWGKACQAFNDCGEDQESWIDLLFKWMGEDETLRRGLLLKGVKSTVLSRMSELIFEGHCDHLPFDL